MNQKKPLFIFELANNHMGNINHGFRIIDEISEYTKEFNFNFAFKLQYRQLDTFIHPDFYNRDDIKFVKRFRETRITKEQFLQIKNHITSKGFLAICTPFDEESVDIIVEQKYSYIKIASCSFTDWPLLEKIANYNMPIIASTAGSSIEDIDKVVSFFEHRERELSIMHCVAEYPTEIKNINLNQIDFLKERYPSHKIGFSTHEAPNELKSIKIAVSKGAEIFEKHVGVETNEYKLNAYSANPEQVYNWLKAAEEAFEYCGKKNERYVFSKKELDDLRDLRRGIFAKDDLKKNQPLFFNDTNRTELREKVLLIAKEVSEFIIESHVPVPDKVDFEISHHYGIDKFYETGTTIINFINR